MIMANDKTTQSEAPPLGGWGAKQYPSAYDAIKKATEANGFNMPSEVLTCSLLKTLAATKPGGRFLELGTGTGLATTWILDGMDKNSTLVSLDNDESVLSIAK